MSRLIKMKYCKTRGAMLEYTKSLAPAWPDNTPKYLGQVAVRPRGSEHTAAAEGTGSVVAVAVAVAAVDAGLGRSVAGAGGDDAAPELDSRTVPAEAYTLDPGGFAESPQSCSRPADSSYRTISLQMCRKTFLHCRRQSHPSGAGNLWKEGQHPLPDVGRNASLGEEGKLGWKQLN